MVEKSRLDDLLVQRKFVPTIKEAQALIAAGYVIVNDRCSDKSGNIHKDNAVIRIKEKCRYVSRGGLKLEKGLHSFHVDVGKKVCVDIGASTGGFTDCLLQNGASKVYAVDVAYGQFSWKLRQDSRVVVYERFNARNISKKDIPEPIDLVVIDASFISLKALIPPLLPLFGDKKEIIALIKPQFELPRENVGAGGVVIDAHLHQQAKSAISDFVNEIGLEVGGIVQSPILGPKGNKEFLIHING